MEKIIARGADDVIAHKYLDGDIDEDVAAITEKIANLIAEFKKKHKDTELLVSSPFPGPPYDPQKGGLIQVFACLFPPIEKIIEASLSVQHLRDQYHSMPKSVE